MLRSRGLVREVSAYLRSLLKASLRERCRERVMDFLRREMWE